MEKCLQCSKELKHVPGRKQKSFCDVNCRNKYFYAKRKQEIALAKAILPSPPVIVNGPEFSVPHPITGPKAAVALHNAENKGQSTEIHNTAKKKADELLKPVAPSGFEAAISEAAQKQIREDIARIKAERCPPERDTPIGRKSWQIDQQKRIKELQDKLA